MTVPQAARGAGRSRYEYRGGTGTGTAGTGAGVRYPAGPCAAPTEQEDPTAPPKRSGRPPLVSAGIPVEQLTRAAPIPLQERLRLAFADLPGVRLGPSCVCVPGTRAGLLPPTVAHGPGEAFLAGAESGHLRPPYDGRVPPMLPAGLARRAVADGDRAYPAGSVPPPRSHPAAPPAGGLRARGSRFAGQVIG